MMTEEEKIDFARADKVIHKVEAEWHYDTMIKYGYEPITKEGVGFVRSYTYQNTKTGHQMSLHTGVNADYFRDDNNEITGHGFWSSLEPHLKKITGTQNV